MQRVEPKTVVVEYYLSILSILRARVGGRRTATLLTTLTINQE